MLLLALIFYLKYEAPPDEQNFPMIMEMLRAADVREDCDEYTSPLDELFERLEMRKPDHIAVKYYKDYHSGSAKTLKSIQITLAARLEKFNLSSLAALTATDELDLPSLGEKKVALFALIPDNDTSFNFLVSILYTQLFQQLFYLADHKYGGSLPIPVHFLMDEFSKEYFQLRKADLPKKPVHNTIKANSRSRQALASSTRKAAVKATTTAVKAVIAKAKALAAAIAAGGWVSVTVIIVVCLIGLIVGSCFGIFFSGEGSGTGQTMRQAVQEINADYQSQIDTARANLTYDELEMSGSRAVWPEVLAVYAVKTTTDPNDPQEVATMDDAKKAILKDIFWQMNEISSHIERKPGKIITETDDGHGNIVETIATVTHTYLYITVSHKTAEEMADRFNFNADQRQQLSELLAEENRSMWSAVLYGIYSGDDAIVTVALSQIGNVGGQPYWSWYGFNSRVEWCACFVSWCANECGYIDSGVIPKFAGCVNGVQWFKDRGQWQDGSFEPSAGQIIFFDWDNKGSSGPQDGQSDHVGIVEKCENGIVYTIEGNSGDSCRQRQYPVGYYEILGYGIPE